MLDLGENRKHKRIEITLRKGSKQIASAIVEHSSISSQKMISATLGINQNENRKKISLCIKSFGALMIFDSRLAEQNVCISNYISTNSLNIFRKTISNIQSFYQQELPNLKECMASCDKRSSCKPEKATKLIDKIEYFFDNQVDNTNVNEFLHYLIN